MTLLLAPAVIDAVVHHAARSHPDECCGALLGRFDGDVRRVSGAWPLANVSPVPARSFAVDPDDYRRVEQQAQQSGVALVGFYHSHPDAPAVPSATDLSAAWPCFSYLIVSRDGSQPGSLTSWRLRDDGSAFDNEEITIWRPGS